MNEKQETGSEINGEGHSKKECTSLMTFFHAPSISVDN